MRIEEQNVHCFYSQYGETDCVKNLSPKTMEMAINILV